MESLESDIDCIPVSDMLKCSSSRDASAFAIETFRFWDDIVHNLMTSEITQSTDGKFLCQPKEQSRHPVA